MIACRFHLLTRLSALCVWAFASTPGNSFADLLTTTGISPGEVRVLDHNTMASSIVWGDATGLSPSAGSIAEDSQGRIYVLEGNRDRIRRYDSQGNFLDDVVTSNFSVNGFAAGIG